MQDDCLKGTSMKKYIDTIRDKITIDDFSEPYQEAASIIGIDNYIKLCEELGGTRIFLPKIKNLTKYRVKTMARKFSE